jgi:uncharacterized protein
MRISISTLLVAALVPLSAGANVYTVDPDAFNASTASTKHSAVAAVIAETDQATSEAFDFLSLYSDGYHNEYYRFKAVREATKGDWEHAATLFEIASRYGDKYSQHRLSLMYWHGVGVARDPAQAYVWADMAAERGYQTFLAIREKMWSEMNDAQRSAVPQIGIALCATYCDAVTLPKMRGLIARKRFQVTGSHAGFSNNLKLRVGIPREAWRLNARDYLDVQDTVGKRVEVDVGGIESADAKQDRVPNAIHPRKSP